jgi:hypothetical protein
MNNDAHNGTLGTADTWLKNNIGPILASSSFQQDGLMIIVFDESVASDTSHGGGRVAMLVIGPQVKSGYRSTTFYQHQSTLRLIAQALGMSSFPGAAASAPSMGEFFASTMPSPTPIPTPTPAPPPPPIGIITPDFAMNATPASITIAQGSSAAVTVGLSPNTNLGRAISLACANLPAHASCAWSNANVSGSAASISQLTISTANAAVAKNRSPQAGGWLEAVSLAPGAFGICGVVMIGGDKGRRRYRGIAMLLLLLALTLALIGCSGATKMAGSANSATTSQTAIGQYSITITATSGTIQHSIPVALTVR